MGAQRTTPELRQAILFGMVTVVPYLVYLAALYVLVSRFRLIASLPGATAGASRQGD